MKKSLRKQSNHGVSPLSFEEDLEPILLALSSRPLVGVNPPNKKPARGEKAVARLGVVFLDLVQSYGLVIQTEEERQGKDSELAQDPKGVTLRRVRRALRELWGKAHVHLYRRRTMSGPI